MSQATLSPIAQAINAHGADIVKTVSAQVAVDDQWLKLGKALHKDGIPAVAFTKPTEKNPNKNYDAGAYAALRGFVIAGISAKAKPERFPYPVPGTKGADQVKGPQSWTVADIVSTDAAFMRDHDVSETFRAVRQRLMVKIDQLIGKVQRYIEREENPDKGRGTKGKKTDAKTAAVTMPETWAAAMQYLTHMQAKCATMPTNDGAEPLSARDIAAVQDGLATIIATVRRYTK